MIPLHPKTEFLDAQTGNLPVKITVTVFWGMIIVGLPYSNPELNATRSGGTPYGASHFAGLAGDEPLTGAERALCVAQGRRLADIALKLRR